MTTNTTAGSPAATAGSPNYGSALVQKNLADLEISIAENSWRHYLLRRLPIIGAMLLAITGIILLFSYLTVQKDDSFGLDSLSWLKTLEEIHPFIFFWLPIATMVVVLIFAYGAFKTKATTDTTSTADRTDWQKMILNLIALAILLLPFILPICDIRHRVLFVFAWGAMLCLVSWQVNRTFGYTRIWARGIYYRRCLNLLEKQITECGLDTTTAGEKRFELLERWSKEIYADSVGDTFYLLDWLTKSK